MKILQRRLHQLAILGLLIGSTASVGALAQSVNGAAQVPSGSIPLATSSAAASTRASGPKIYLTDTNKRLWTYDTGNNAIRYIGTASQRLTDISFAPGGKLFGITFTAFYKIDPNNAKLTKVGNLGTTGINALFCYSSSSCYAHSFSNAKLYRINTATGRATVIGNTGIFKSGGDLVRVNGALYLSSDNATKRLVKLNPSTGAVLGSASVGLTNLFGLAATAGTRLFGFANTSVYKLNPSTGAKTLVKNLSTVSVPGVRFRVGQIFGAAYNGYF